jgi:hypothetical protein
MLRQGARGSEVTQLQEQLNGSPPTALPQLNEDGVFGAKTSARVREYQTNNALAVDGIVGPKTWESLLSAPVAIDPAAAFAAMRPLFYSARRSMWYDPQRLFLLNSLEATLAGCCQPRAGASNEVGATFLGVLANPLFWMLVIIIVLTLMLITDPVHRSNLQKLMKLAAEAVEERGEEAEKKIKRAAEEVREFWKQLTGVKTECERLADPKKLEECLKKFDRNRRDKFFAVHRLINLILSTRWDQFGRQVVVKLGKAIRELGGAIKDYVDALNDLLRCLGCPEMPYPDIPNLPIPD